MDVLRSIARFKSKNSKIVEAFLNNQKNYNDLLEEAIYSIKYVLNQNRIDTSQVVGRVKDLNSFIYKQIRKEYTDPFIEIEDIVGVKIVCLFDSQKMVICDLLKEEFDIHEIIDKNKDLKNNEFGYNAIHLTASMPNSLKGTRYNSIKEIKFEIQIKTLLQDSWSSISHKIIYKEETNIDSEILKSMNAISASLSLLDSNFENIRISREKQKEKIDQEINKLESLMNLETSEDSLKEYLVIKFPSYQFVSGSLSSDIQELKEYKYKTIRSVDELFNRTFLAVNAYLDKKQNSEGKEMPQFILSMAFGNTKYRYFEFLGNNNSFSEFDHLVY